MKWRLKTCEARGNLPSHPPKAPHPSQARCHLKPSQMLVVQCGQREVMFHHLGRPITQFDEGCFSLSLCWTSALAHVHFLQLPPEPGNALGPASVLPMRATDMPQSSRPSAFLDASYSEPAFHNHEADPCCSQISRKNEWHLP